MKRTVFFLTLILSLLTFSCDFGGEDEPSIPSIKKAGWTSETLSMAVGESKSCSFSIEPLNCLDYYKVEYSVSSSVENIVEVTDKSNSGCIITAKQSGSCILVGKVGEITSYLTVTIEGEYEVSPYIVTPFVAYEMKKGERKSFTVSLYGGSATDNALFDFSSSNPDCISIEKLSNSCVVQSNDSGFSRITISHPKAKYDSYVVFYSTENEKTPCYITTSSNVIQLSLDGGSMQYSVSLVGSEKNDNSLFAFELTEGKENVDMLYNNNFVSLTPKSLGTSLIKVTHPDCEVPLYLQVVIIKTTFDPYIESSSSFCALKPYEDVIINCSVIGSNLSNDNNCFSYEISDNDLFFVNQINNSFYIQALKDGKGKLVIKNTNCKYPHEIYIVVDSGSDITDSYYITTGQNIIKMEVGEETGLNMLLVGGNHSDQNNFSWNVDDGSVIDVTTTFGKVNYSSRAAITDTFETLEANALITAKKTGIATICISNPKSKVMSYVKVKVYPKGFLEGKRYSVSGDGLIKVITGKSVDYTLTQTGGENPLTSISWETENESIAKALGSSLTCNVSGISGGVTDLHAKSDFFQNDYISKVIVGTQAEIEEIKAIYTDNRFLKVFSKSRSYFEIKSSGNINNSNYHASINDTDIASVSMSENTLIVNALKGGNAEIVITNSDCTDSLILFLEVLDEVSIEKPFYFKYEKFLGVVIGEEKEYELSLVGAGDAYVNKIQWTNSDSSIVSMTGNGNKVRVKALKEGECEIKASSGYAKDDAVIVVYTAKTQEELENKVILSCDKLNYLSYIGNDIFVKINVNDSDKNREQITWECDDLSVLRIDSNYDSAYLRCLNEGNCVVTVRCKSAILRLFVSVKKDLSGVYEKDISVPQILELLTGSNKTITAVTTGLTQDEINAIEWKADNTDILDVKGSADVCYLSVLKKGYSKITVKQKNLGIEKQIQIVAADTIEELQSLYVIQIEKGLYSIKENESINLKLGFGSKIPSDEIISKIQWKNSNDDVCSVSYNGERATITGLNEGISVLTVDGEGIFNSLSVKIKVGQVSNKYYIDCDKLFGLVVGKEKNLNLTLYDGNGNEVLNDLRFSYELSNDSVVSILSADSVLKIKALKEGNCYLNINHPLVEKGVKVLIYTAKTESLLNDAYPLMTNKDHYLLSPGDSAKLSLVTVDDTKLSSIKWSISDSSVCSYTVSSDKKSVNITAKKEGSTVFTAKHTDSPFDVKFYVYVSEYKNADSKISIITENIIGLKKDDVYTTTVTTSLSESENSSLIWTCNKEGIISFEGNGKSCNITALKEGVCELKVSYNSYVYRTILVYVKESDAQKESAKYFNNDKRYYVLKADEEICVKPFYTKNVANTKDVTFTDVFENNVVSFENKEGVLYVKALNEGISEIRVRNSECENSYSLYFEVNEKKEEVSDTKSGFLTTTKMVYQLSDKDTLTPVSIKVSAVDIEPSLYSSINWKSDDPSIITLNPSGESCLVYANKKGETYINVSSVYSQNVLRIKVIVGETEKTYPYIKASLDNVLLKVGESGEVTFSLENDDSFDSSLLSFEKEGEVFDVTKLNNKAVINGVKQGQGLLHVKYQKEGIDDISLLVNVKGVASDIIYLTTDNNYSVITQRSSKKLSVSLNGYEEYNGENYIWSVESENPKVEGQSVISLSGSGKERVCEALNEGLATIKVVHKNTSDITKSAVYPLYMTVRVTDYADVNPIYITTETPVVSLYEGGRNTVKVDLVNGNESENALFDWNTPDSDIIKITAGGNMCVLEGLKPGTARITVKHPSAVGLNLDIIVIVDKDDSKEKLYISTNDTLIEMKPTDSYKNINVNLVGGTPEQSTLFSWEIISNDATVKNKDGTSNAVIELIASGDSAIVKPKREGVSIIRVRNSSTTHYIDIKVMVSLYSNLNFSQSSISVMEGEIIDIDMNTPTGKSVIYESSNENVCTVSGTSKKCLIEGSGKGTCVVRAYTSDGLFEDEILVNVTKNTSAKTNYISTSVNVLSMNTLTDSKGITLSAALNGTDVLDSDSDEVTWTISEKDSSVISFVGSGGKREVKGREITVKPLSGGDAAIVVSHSKAKNSKNVYVSVTQDGTSMKLSDTYFTIGKEEIQSASCTLTNVAESEYDNVVWKSEDSSVVQLLLSKEDGTVRGNTVQFKGLKKGETTLSCTYGSIVKYISVFITEKLMLSIPSGNAKLACNDDTWHYYPIYCVPADRYEDITISASSSIYANVEKFVNESEKTCYIKVRATSYAGTTVITANLENLSARMSLVTSDDVGVKIQNIVYKDKSGKERVETSLTNAVELDITDKSARVYFETDPRGLLYDNRAGNYTMNALSSPKFSASTNNFINLSFGEENGKRYIEIKPLGCGFASIDLVNGEVSGINMTLPICVKDPAFKPKFRASFQKENGSSFDEDHGLIVIRNNEVVTINVEVPSDSVYHLSQTSTGTVNKDGRVSNSNTAVVIRGNNLAVNKTDYTTLRSVTNWGTVTIKVDYPKYCGVSGSVTKTFVVTYENWQK